MPAGGFNQDKGYQGSEDCRLSAMTAFGRPCGHAVSGSWTSQTGCPAYGFLILFGSPDFLQGGDYLRAGEILPGIHRSRPPAGVLNNFLDCGMVEGGIGLMSGLKIEDFTVAAVPGASAAEGFPAVEPAGEN